MPNRSIFGILTLSITLYSYIGKVDPTIYGLNYLPDTPDNEKWFNFPTETTSVSWLTGQRRVRYSSSTSRPRSNLLYYEIPFVADAVPYEADRDGISCLVTIYRIKPLLPPKAKGRIETIWNWFKLKKKKLPHALENEEGPWKIVAKYDTDGIQLVRNEVQPQWLTENWAEMSWTSGSYTSVQYGNYRA